MTKQCAWSGVNSNGAQVAHAMYIAVIKTSKRVLSKSNAIYDRTKGGAGWYNLKQDSGTCAQNSQQFSVVIWLASWCSA